MLDVAYEAVDTLPPGRLAKIEEDRGWVRVLLDKTQPLPLVVVQLNIEIDDFLNRSNWFQLWGDEIVSRATPDQPLRVRYVLLPHAPEGAGIAEDRGVVSVYVNEHQSVEEFAAVMNPATKQHLDSGRWFQMYAGEIIDNAPEPMSQV